MTPDQDDIYDLIDSLQLEEREMIEDLDPAVLEKLAEAAHRVWMDGKLNDGWRYAVRTDKAHKLHECLLPYNQLPEKDKQSDRDLVKGIPEILATAGYKIVPIGDDK